MRTTVKRRSSKGQSLVEFAIAATALIPIVLLGRDAFLMIYAIQLNDSTCKEAARLASSGDPELAYARAQRSLESKKGSNPWSCVPQLVAAQASVKKSQLEELSPYGGSVIGVVDVTTDTEVTPLVIGWFLGNKRRLSFQCTQELPITYVLPNILDDGSEER